VTALARVDIVGLPLDVYQRASEHTDELLREFALIRGDDGDHVPARLLALVTELNLRFGPFAQGASDALQQALDRGDATVDLCYDVPVEAAAAAAHLGDLFDEADEFCRSGDLLTLATLPEAVGFRRWFLDEFVAQIGGAAPRSWADAMGTTLGG
jgi:hypothetical protein